MRIEPKKEVKKKKLKKRDQARRELDPEYISEEELEEARKTMPDTTPEHLRFLHFLSDLIVDLTLQDLDQLETEPGGYHPERTLPCKICGDYVSGEKACFDHNGQQCIPCHQAIQNGIIPADLAPEDFYTETQLDLYFTLDRKTINRLLKSNKLITRQTSRQRLFLHRDNPNFFPPKHLLKSAIIHDGDQYTFPPWYTLHDPQKVLKGYGIARFLR